MPSREPTGHITTWHIDLHVGPAPVVALDTVSPAGHVNKGCLQWMVFSCFLLGDHEL